MSSPPTQPAIGCSIGAWVRAQHPLPRLECELLLCHHLGIDRARVIACPERLLSAAELEALDSDAARLHSGEPLAYLLGEREFWGLAFKVTPDVLIPRPETETLVELALEHLTPGSRVLDLGTGSGAIAIALATSLPLEIVALDSSAAALDVAAANARHNRAAVHFLVSDWYSAISVQVGDDTPDCTATHSDPYHLIVANPPYIAEGDPHLPALHYEPRCALVSGKSGLDDLTTIIRGAASYLLPGGRLLVEHGWNQGEAVRDLFAHAGFLHIATHRDLAGQERITGGVCSVESAATHREAEA